jgi:hypothetical protein
MFFFSLLVLLYISSVGFVGCSLFAREEEDFIFYFYTDFQYQDHGHTKTAEKLDEENFMWEKVKETSQLNSNDFAILFGCLNLNYITTHLLHHHHHVRI